MVSNSERIKGAQKTIQATMSHKLDHIHLMRLFILVVQHASFSKAANQLSITATKASKDIRHLEQSLQTTLLNRTTRSVNMTDSGVIFYNSALQILDIHQKMLDNMLSLKCNLSGELRISAPSLWGKIVLTPIILAFKQLYPEVVLIAHYSNQLVDIKKENIHIAFRSTQLSDEPYIARFIQQDNYTLCASRGYLQQHSSINTPENLDHHQFITLVNHTSNSEHLVFHAPEKEIHKHIKGQLSFSNKEDIYKAVKENFGIAVLPSYLISSDIQTGKLVSLLQHYPLKSFKFYALYTQKRSDSALLNTFIDFVTAQINSNKNTIHASSKDS
ncbi:MAG: LysR family transcriptional activator of dmlA [Oceanospirillaceae bacterium]|jgi:LysR family transcriptional activator of dmlA